jgi:predicted acyltransferase
VAAGWLLGVTGVCPVVKRIWTPSWTLVSGGWACLFLAAFYWWVDLKGHRLPRIEAVGLNSIAMYVIVHLWDRFLADSFKIHFGWNVLGWLPGALEQFLPWFLTWLVLWWCCLWMHRRQIYVRL